MAKRGRGRPAGGLKRGEMVSDYPSYSLRMPLTTRARLQATALVLDVPIWRLIHDLIEAHIAALPLAQRRRIATLSAAR